jgi:hypothetical protein
VQANWRLLSSLSLSLPLTVLPAEAQADDAEAELDDGASEEDRRVKGASKGEETGETKTDVVIPLPLVIWMVPFDDNKAVTSARVAKSEGWGMMFIAVGVVVVDE